MTKTMMAVASVMVMMGCGVDGGVEGKRLTFSRFNQAGTRIYYDSDLQTECRFVSVNSDRVYKCVPTSSLYDSSMGFITTDRLPVGYTGLGLATSSDQTYRVYRFTVIARPTATGAILVSLGVEVPLKELATPIDQ